MNGHDRFQVVYCQHSSKAVGNRATLKKSDYQQRRGSSASTVVCDIATRIDEQIERGAFESDGRLPSRTQLAKSFGCAPSTISAAISELVRQKRVETFPGKGTFVRAGKDSETETLTIGLIGWFAGHSSAAVLREDDCWRGRYASLASEASKNNCAILLIPGTDSEPIDVGAVVAHRPDVVVSIGIQMRPETIAAFRRQGLPVIFASEVMERYGVSYVAYDAAAALRDSLRIFHEHGHRRMGFLSLRTLEPMATDQMAGHFAFELALRGLAYEYMKYCRVIDVRRGPRFQEDIHEAARREMACLLDFPEPPTAVFCWNSAMAEGGRRRSG